MAYDNDSLTRRTIGPALASAVVGLALGVAAVIGVATLTDQDSLPEGKASSNEQAGNVLLGGAEYGTRQ